MACLIVSKFFFFCWSKNVTTSEKQIVCSTGGDGVCFFIYYAKVSITVYAIATWLRLSVGSNSIPHIKPATYQVGDDNESASLTHTIAV